MNEKQTNINKGPGNVLIDWATNESTQGKQLYDKDGLIARSGKVNHELLKVRKKKNLKI